MKHLILALCVCASTASAETWSLRDADIFKETLPPKVVAPKPSEPECLRTPEEAKTKYHSTWAKYRVVVTNFKTKHCWFPTSEHSSTEVTSKQLRVEEAPDAKEEKQDIPIFQRLPPESKIHDFEEGRALLQYMWGKSKNGEW